MLTESLGLQFPLIWFIIVALKKYEIAAVSNVNTTTQLKGIVILKFLQKVRLTFVVTIYFCVTTSNWSKYKIQLCKKGFSCDSYPTTLFPARYLCSLVQTHTDIESKAKKE